MSLDCPYCNNEACLSKDHIFPSFLGGSKTVLIGKKCNNKFGHSFEAETFKNLVPLMVFLRIHRIKTPHYCRWTEAFIYEGRKFNLDSNLHAVPSKPEVIKDILGRVVRATGSANFHKKLLKFLTKNNIAYTKFDKSIPKFKISELQFQLKIDSNIRKLCVKMCIGLLKHLSSDADLFSYKKIDDYQVLLDLRIHPEVEKIKTPLSHLILVESNARKKECFGIVQFYGIMQFYVDLSDRFFGKDICYIALLDPDTLNETFSNSNDKFRITPADTTIHAPSHSSFEQYLMARMNIEFLKKFGTGLITDFDLDLW